ncbi:M14 family zinc carboxypeptidase [Virgibacillus sp. JSM 102003]|uniref:M14 family zinc carboxypeptidase n=1 Tax=Virgibacillus sp. JSM 102003 TaxID=1562108 RepID=UPI0035C001CA
MKFRQLLVVSFVFILSLSISTLVNAAAENGLVTLSLDKSYKITIENEEILTLEKDTVLYGTRLNSGDVEVQLFQKSFTVSQEKFTIIKESEESEYRESDSFKTTISKNIVNDIILYNTDNKEVGFVNSANTLDVYQENNRNYILIGNKAFYFLERDVDEKEKEKLEKEDKSVDENKIVEEGKQSYDDEIVSSTSYRITDFTKTDFFQVTQSNTAVYIKKSNGDLKSVGNLDKGEVYHTVAVYGNWLKIQYGNTNAFIWKAATKPSSSPPSKSTKVEGGMKAKVIGDASVYDNSGEGLRQIGYVKEGTNITYISRVGDWYKVNFGGRVGYIYESAIEAEFTPATKYFRVNEINTTVYLKSSTGLTAVGKLKKNQNYQITSVYGNWLQIQYGGSMAYVWKGATEPSPFSPSKSTKIKGGMKAKVIGDASVYDNSGEGLRQIGYVKEGTNITYISRVGDWYKVNFGGRVGYIYESAIEAEFTAATKYFRVNEINTTVYLKSSTGLTAVGKLKKNQNYQITSIYENWLQIQYGKSMGYVWKEATEPSPSAPSKSLKVMGEMKAKVIGDVSVYDNSGKGLRHIGSIKEGSKITYINRTGNWYKINFGGRTGYIYYNSVNPLFSETVDYFKVNTVDVSLYKRINGTLKAVGKLKKGEVFERVRGLGNWHEVKIGDGNGFVWKDATSPSTGRSIKNLQNKKSIDIDFTTNENVTVYDNSTGSLISMGNLYKGSKFSLIRATSNWIEIDFNGRIGYIYKPSVNIHLQSIVDPKTIYSYSQMQDDLRVLANMYPDLTQLKSIGKSLDGRNIYALKLGNGNNEVFYNGSHHAREHMTTNVLMEMIDEYAYSYTKGDYYSGYNVRNILNNTSIWFVPMVNPDGVTLNQEGISGLNNDYYANLVYRLNGYSDDFSSWKANARGVDLNRQYPADWPNIKWSAGYPGYKNYKGEAPLTEPEVKAIYDFTNDHDFKTTVAYHSSGEILYWYFNQVGSAYDRDRAIASRIKNITGYNLVTPQPNPSGGGYTDWFVQDKGLPGITIEISPYTYQNPVPLYNWDFIWRENRSVGLDLAKEAYTR